jgi:cold-inducible RNA-binding protein
MNTNKLFIGNLHFEITAAELKALFAEFGTVVGAEVIMDRLTNRSRGFGFVEMSTPEEASKALTGMNGKDIKGRLINVAEARPREERPRI